MIFRAPGRMAAVRNAAFLGAMVASSALAVTAAVVTSPASSPDLQITSPVQVESVPSGGCPAFAAVKALVDGVRRNGKGPSASQKDVESVYRATYGADRARSEGRFEDIDDRLALTRALDAEDCRRAAAHVGELAQYFSMPLVERQVIDEDLPSQLEKQLAAGWSPLVAMEDSVLVLTGISRKDGALTFTLQDPARGKTLDVSAGSGGAFPGSIGSPALSVRRVFLAAPCVKLRTSNWGNLTWTLQDDSTGLNDPEQERLVRSIAPYLRSDESLSLLGSYPGDAGRPVWVARLSVEGTTSVLSERLARPASGLSDAVYLVLDGKSRRFAQPLSVATAEAALDSRSVEEFARQNDSLPYSSSAETAALLGMVWGYLNASDPVGFLQLVEGVILPETLSGVYRDGLEQAVTLRAPEAAGTVGTALQVGKVASGLAPDVFKALSHRLTVENAVDIATAKGLLGRVDGGTMSGLLDDIATRWRWKGLLDNSARWVPAAVTGIASLFAAKKEFDKASRTWEACDGADEMLAYAEAHLTHAGRKAAVVEARKHLKETANQFQLDFQGALAGGRAAAEVWAVFGLLQFVTNEVIKPILVKLAGAGAGGWFSASLGVGMWSLISGVLTNRGQLEPFSRAAYGSAHLDQELHAAAFGSVRPRLTGVVPEVAAIPEFRALVQLSLLLQGASYADMVILFTGAQEMGLFGLGVSAESKESFRQAAEEAADLARKADAQAAEFAHPAVVAVAARSHVARMWNAGVVSHEECLGRCTAPVLKGKVTDESGEPIAGAFVTAWVNGQLKAQEQADPDTGIFGFCNLSDGTYEVRAAARGYCAAAKNVSLRQGVQDPEPLEMPLRKADMPAEDLHAMVERGEIQVDARAVGHASYGSFPLTIQVSNLTCQDLRVSIPAGTTFRNENDHRQNLVVGRDTEVLVRADTRGQQAIVGAYCISRSRGGPSGSALTLDRSLERPQYPTVLRMAALNRWDETRKGEVQGAIWHFSDGVNVSPGGNASRMVAAAEPRRAAVFSTRASPREASMSLVILLVFAVPLHRVCRRLFPIG